MKIFYYRIISLLFISSLLFEVSATSDVVSNLEVFKVVYSEKSKKEQLIPVKSAKSGEVLQYRLFYKNKGREKQNQFIVKIPVPTHTVYVEGSASPTVGSLSFFEVSIDGGTGWQIPPLFETVIENGKKIKKPVSSDRYTHLRWRMKKPFYPKNSHYFSYRVKVG